MSAIMRAGQLRKRLALQSKTESQDNFGSVTHTWSTDETIWGAVQPLTGRELVEAQQIDAESNVKITIRYRVGLSTNLRILWGSRVYEINAVLNFDERNARVELLCRETT